MNWQYAYIGPALFELGMNGSEAALCRTVPGGALVKPLEVWLPINQMWLRLDGQWISGSRNGQRFGFRPNWFNRLRVQIAANRWMRKQLP